MTGWRDSITAFLRGLSGGFFIQLCPLEWCHLHSNSVLSTEVSKSWQWGPGSPVLCFQLSRTLHICREGGRHMEALPQLGQVGPLTVVTHWIFFTDWSPWHNLGAHRRRKALLFLRACNLTSLEHESSGTQENNSTHCSFLHSLCRALCKEPGTFLPASWQGWLVMILGVEPRACPVLGKHSSAELYPQP